MSMYTNIARSSIVGQYPVALRRHNDGTYAVVYGMQVDYFGTEQAQEALEQFNNCVLHTMECAGMLNVDENA